MVQAGGVDGHGNAASAMTSARSFGRPEACFMGDQAFDRGDEYQKAIDFEPFSVLSESFEAGDVCWR